MCKTRTDEIGVMQRRKLTEHTLHNVRGTATHQD